MKRLLITTAIIGLFLFGGTFIAIFYAKGYRITPLSDKGPIEGTGLLVVTSKPDAAKVFINDHLSTATNNTINLPEGEYEVKVTKDGYSTWKKKITVKNEIVNRADALLFPNAPKLESITLTGADNAVVDPSGNLLAFTVASSSAEKNGIYTLEMNSKQILSFGVSTNLLVNDIRDSFSNAKIEFSPDGNEMLATVSGKIGNTTYLLSPRDSNQTPKDVTATLFNFQKNWKKLSDLKVEKELASINRKELRQLVTNDFSNIVFSPDRDKILYEASISARIPLIINPPVIGANSTTEQRTIEKGNMYVYDIKEDRNYLIEDRKNQNFERKTHYLWHPDSSHLIYIKERKIYVSDFDLTNQTIVYAGPFVDDFVIPWPDGSSLLILTNLNIPETPNNLYRLILK